MAVDATQARWKNLVWYVVLTALSIVVLFPVYMTLVRALSNPAAYVREGQPLLPVSLEWNVWSRAWTGGELDQKLIVSIAVTTVIVVGQLVTSTLAAYAFAFLQFPLKRLAFVIFMVVRQMNKLKKQPAPADPTEKDCPQCLSKIPIKAKRCAHCTTQLEAA